MMLYKVLVKAFVKRGLQPDDSFVNKVSEFQELLDVRHSVMLIGSKWMWEDINMVYLAACHNDGAQKPVCVYETVNPKAVTSNELYGFMTLAKSGKMVFVNNHEEYV